MATYSVSPQNEMFELPGAVNTSVEAAEVRELCRAEREKGRQIVVVQGLGFVGAVMSAIVADSEVDGRSPYFVLGVNRPSAGSYWKIPLINRGLSPFKTQDPEVDRVFHSVNRKGTLRATWVPEAYGEADIVIVDIGLDAVKSEPGKAQDSGVAIEAFKNAIDEVGHRMRPDTLVLIETTVPPGTVEHVAKPIIERCFLERGIDLSQHQPLIGYSYERIMPGDHYVESVSKIWRTFSGTSEEARRRTKELLSSIIDTKSFPLWSLANPTAAEMAKVLENSYRAMNIAFIYEWTLFAEDVGINMFEVVNSIRVRKGTHDNMMFPGLGVGGYCLTKDPILADWASRAFFGRKERLNLSLEAVNINDLMPHHTIELLKRSMDLKGRKVTILGASYRRDVDDTRNSPSAIVYDDIVREGGVPVLHDPYATVMEGREDLEVLEDLAEALKDASAVVLAVNHRQYKGLSIDGLTAGVREGATFIDAFDVLSDSTIAGLKSKGFPVFGYGKGHIKYL
ncbi:MAG TPA: nucleotide sugar dehydrogenase [Methanocella sp.]|jgi:nucleotide sugar dehydrogenase